LVVNGSIVRGLSRPVTGQGPELTFVAGRSPLTAPGWIRDPVTGS
jgi:hypothetical protein